MNGPKPDCFGCQGWPHRSFSPRMNPSFCREAASTLVSEQNREDLTRRITTSSGAEEARIENNADGTLLRCV